MYCVLYLYYVVKVSARCVWSSRYPRRRFVRLQKSLAITGVLYAYKKVLPSQAFCTPTKKNLPSQVFPKQEPQLTTPQDTPVSALEIISSHPGLLAGCGALTSMIAVSLWSGDSVRAAYPGR